MTLNGEMRGMRKWEGLIEDSFYDEGLQMPADPSIIWPYIQGREVALAPPAPGAFTIFGVLSKIAGVIALLALGKLIVTKPQDNTPSQGAGAGPVIPRRVSSQNAGAASADPTSRGVPLWKQRSGLVADIAELEALPKLPTESPLVDELFEDFYDVIAVAKQFKFSMRSILIGLVGAAFVVLLTATLWGMLADTKSNDQAVGIVALETVMTEQTAVDTQPGRHWTDIDVSPIADWFMAKAVLATSGDRDAMILMGVLIGGLLVALFMLRWFFVMRCALQPRTTARMDSMGL
jgi:hypothetical protein